MYKEAVRVCLTSLLMLGFCLTATEAQVKVDSNSFSGIEARSIGPATMSGRILAIDAINNNPQTLYVGAAGGGVWKSTNGGTTFKPIFEKNIQSIGAITIDQSKPDTVWVGTGEADTRNSVSVGNGLYKTTDGGENWTLVGLEKSERISRILIDPKKSDTIYVSVVGNLWNDSEDRGLYKTTDGGKTWEKILYVDAKTGCSDIAIDPQETNTIYAGMWQFRRLPYIFTSGGSGSGLHKSTDGGKTWKKLTSGLPEGELGRIAIAVAPSRPNVVYANVEAKKTGLYRSDDMGETWRKVSSSFYVTARPFYFSHLYVDPKDYNKVYKTGFSLGLSRDGGVSFGEAGGSTHGDHHALWIDPNNTSHLYLGTDGGVYETQDSRLWTFLKGLPVSQFYHVSYDMKYPYNIYGGLQDNGSWVGPSTSSIGVRNKDWKNVGFGDGFYTFADPNDPNIIYSEWQGGRLLRYHRNTGELKAIQPFPKKGEPKYRFNWNAPVEIGEKNSKALYIGSQFLLRSTDQGESWERISEDLTTNNKEKQQQEKSGGLTIDNSGAENHCTIYAINESPIDNNIIWVGTDDGNLQVTRDGGKSWENVVANIQGLPANTWCSSVEASNHDVATAYVTFDGHQTGDMKPYVFKTTDFGKTWKALATDDIKGYVHIIREDLVKPNLLFLGTEFGLFISIDGGNQWSQFTGDFPKAAVRDLAIHKRDSDLIIATHGRGIYIIDDLSAFRQLTPQVLEKPIHLFNTRPSYTSVPIVEQDFPGDDEYVGKPLPEIAYITYYLKERHIKGDFKVEIFNSEGKLMTTLPGGKRKGLNRVGWAMRLKPPKVPPSPSLEGGLVIGPLVPEGTYTVKVTKDKDVYEGKIEITADPKFPHSAADRKLQQESIMKLYLMQERLAFVAALVTNARDQAKAKSKDLKTDPLAKTLDAFAEKLDTLHKTLVATNPDGIVTGEERLRERVIDLYNIIGRFGGKPTNSQLDRLTNVEQEIEDANKEFEAITTKELEVINTKLKTKKQEPIKLLTKEEFDKKQAESQGTAQMLKNFTAFGLFR